MTKSVPGEDLLAAAVDLGSNSFHMVVGRRTSRGIEIVSRERERVRIAEGLTRRGDLQPAAQVRALDCLESFGRRIEGLSAGHVRAIGTNAFRRAENAEEFLVRAESALGCPIDIVSGGEEARLVYLGVDRSLGPSPDARRLVIDIGGGSTECIIGQNGLLERVASLQIGCVSNSERFFPSGKVTERSFEKAVVRARLKLEPIEVPFRRLGWSEAYGTAGTIHSTAKILNALGQTKRVLRRDDLEGLKRRLIEHEDMATIELDRLKDDRRAVLPGGLAVLIALFDGLGIDTMSTAPGGLREGILEDLLDRLDHHDARRASVDRFAARCKVDTEHAERVSEVATFIFDRVRKGWQLDDESWRVLLGRVCAIHEVGIFVSPIGHHKHGSYLVRHSDLDGFSIDEREALAVLVRNQRKKPQVSILESVRHFPPTVAHRLCSILRLAVIFCRDRRPLSDQGRGVAAASRIRAKNGRLELGLSRDWIIENPLTTADLDRESDAQELLGIELVVGP